MWARQNLKYEQKKGSGEKHFKEIDPQGGVRKTVKGRRERKTKKKWSARGGERREYCVRETARERKFLMTVLYITYLISREIEEINLKHLECKWKTIYIIYFRQTNKTVTQIKTRTLSSSKCYRVTQIT